MTPAQQREETLFAAAVAKLPAERAVFLDGACHGDAELRARLEALLAEHEQPDELTPAVGPSGTLKSSQTTVLATVTEQAGDRIGPYKLREKIGEGGCGVVYVAEQEKPVRRRVALKVIKLGMDTRSVIARFEAERQALAMMDHPNIAKVLDAGATEAGRPYFVMELVRGIRITDYCDQHHLSTKERLDLFIKVCHAIQHAHQKGIIHRDIKPSNILVTLHDGAPVPKVIDFGIAKATEGRLSDLTVYTELHQFIGTPAYMSPEQAEMSGLDIDTRSDIYALGVLLYELLTGQTPFDAKELVKSGIDEIRRTIREVEPPKPSTRLSTMLNADLTRVAKRHGAESSKFSKLVRGDLDWIVMTCLEKDRTRRYETANGLATDIQRHLNNEPIRACPPSAGYQFRKFARRHRPALRVATGIAVLLVAATAISTWQAVRATQAVRKTAVERDKKELARQEAEAISKFLSEVFRSPDPSRNGRTITVAETLDKAAKKLDTDLLRQPVQRAALQVTLGATYRALGLPSQAIPLQEKARDYFRASFGPEHIRTLNAMHQLALSYSAIGRQPEAVQLGEEVLKAYRKLSGPEHPDTLAVMNNLATFYAGDRSDEALKLEEEVLTIRRKVLGAEHRDTLASMSNLSISYRKAGRISEAIQLQEKALALKRRALPNHPFLAVALDNMASLYAETGRNDEALRLREEYLALNSKINGPEHADTLQAMREMAGAYSENGRPDAELKLREEVLALSRKVLGLKDPRTARALNDLAWMYVSCPDTTLRNPKRAVELATLSVEAVPSQLICVGTLGAAQYRAGENATAIALLQKALGMARTHNRDDASAVFGYYLAMAHWEMGEWNQSQQDYRESVAWMEKSLGKSKSMEIEMRRAREEAAALLKVPGDSAKK